MRRLIDITLSLLILIVLSPLLIAVAILIAIESPGSPFYLAPRAGQNGRRFLMWKFRTMVLNAANLGPAVTGNKDSRITGLGSMLRKTKIDELPQFVNVLKGDMTLVGPRPESPGIVAQYSDRQRQVLQAKPGVTGKVQLESGEESESIPAGVDAEKYYIEYLMDQKIQADLAYLKKRTALSDTQIVLSTVSYVFRAAASARR